MDGGVEATTSEVRRYMGTEDMADTVVTVITGVGAMAIRATMAGEAGSARAMIMATEAMAAVGAIAAMAPGSAMDLVRTARRRRPALFHRSRVAHEAVVSEVADHTVAGRGVVVGRAVVGAVKRPHHSS